MKPEIYPHDCPTCGSRDVDEFERDSDDEFQLQDWSCGECGFIYRLEFEFKRWTPL